MTLAATSNNTASIATSKALNGIVENLNTIAANSPNLKALLAPSETVLTELHNYATGDALNEKSKSVIKEGFQEFGIQVADGLRALYQRSKSSFKSLLSRTEKLTERLKILSLPKKSVVADTTPEKAIKKIVQYSRDHQIQITKMIRTDTPIVSFKAKASPGRANNIIDVKEPLKLFEYIDLAHRRNKLIGREPDYKIKAWIQLAYCVQKHSETEGKFVATRDEVTQALNLKPRSLSAEAAKWNEAMSRVKQKSAINDYFIPLTDEAIKKREAVIQSHNEGRKGKEVKTLNNPNKLIEYLTLTKQMQAIKLFIDNQPEAEQNQNYKSLDIVMQWYIQLGNTAPIVSLQDYARQEYNIHKETDLANIKRIKSMWNLGKLSE
jgi:hypothetical protein